MTPVTIMLAAALAILVVLLAGMLILLHRIARLGTDGMERALREEQRLGREEAGRQAQALRGEIAQQQRAANELLTGTLHQLGTDQRATLETLMNHVRYDNARLVEAVDKVVAGTAGGFKELQESNEKKLGQMQADNERRLDEMRRLVDEKLQNTLEKRLGESFKLVGERLEAVQRGLGEMQVLATGVGDLNRVLGNVKERGTWGEFQLGAILGEILLPEQYDANVRVGEGPEVVEYAVRLPGHGGRDETVWLPIDSKFPTEAYESLVEASAAADAAGVQAATARLRATVLRMAQDIQRKYISPPASTDFAILFLPTEGLFAEVLRLPGLQNELQQRCRVLVAGPTTLAAILNSLRVGFQTLAIEQRAGEVWRVLGAVKTEFAVFGEYLERIKRQIQAVSNTLDQSDRRTRAMISKLRSVSELSQEESAPLLGLEDEEDGESARV